MSGHLSSDTSTTTNRSSTGFWKGQILTLGSTIVTAGVAAAVTVFVTAYLTNSGLEEKINGLEEKITTLSDKMSFLEGRFKMLLDKIKN